MTDAATIALNIKTNGTSKALSDIKKVSEGVSVMSRISASTIAVGTAIGQGINSAIGIIKTFGQEAINSADQMAQLIAKSSMSSDYFETLAYSAKLSKVGVDTVSNSIKEMQKSITESKPELAKFGVDFVKLKEMSPEEQFKSLLDTMQNLQKPAEKTAFAMAAFGDDKIMQVANNLALATKQMNDLGLIMKDGALQTAQDLNQQLELTKMRIQVAFVNALPIIEEFGYKSIAVVRLIWNTISQTITNITTNLFLISDNFNVLFKWISDNWQLLWSNMGQTMISLMTFGVNQMVDIIMAPVKVISDTFKKMWEGITTGNVTALADAVIKSQSLVMQTGIESLKSFGINANQFFADLNQSIGTTVPSFMSGDLKDGYADIAKDFNDAWDAAEKLRNNRDNGKINGDSNGASQYNAGGINNDNTAAMIKGSQEAWKVLSAFYAQKAENPQVKIARDQLDETKTSNKYLESIPNIISLLNTPDDDPNIIQITM